MIGKMEIQLSRRTFSPGGMIEGKVVLELNSPQKAKGVIVELIGERRENSFNISTRKTESKIVTVFQFSQPLDVEKEYPANQRLEYPFQLKAPDATPDPQIGGNLGTVFNLLRPLAGSSPINWHLKAKLDVFGFDLNKSVQIMIS